MTDRKISDLTNITGANLADDDEFVVVDTSADETKAITRSELVAGTVTTANVTSAGALMDSELTDITAVKALDQGVATTDDPTFTNTQLAAIAESKSVTAVDVFVYDTSKDSDGGAWRKRTQGTSWYNETLNTSTRGSRREFPAVAVIVAEANKITIYDGDDPALPMWMVFTNLGLLAYASTTLAGIAMVNGLMAFGATAGEFEVNFLSEQMRLRQSGNDRSQRNISTRNTAALVVNGLNKFVVGTPVNDVAMTVLPDAPIDPATGLPVPTIAVATDGGVSVIKDDGTVADGGDLFAMVSTEFSDDGLYYSFGNGALYFATYADIAGGDGFGDQVYAGSPTSPLPQALTRAQTMATDKTDFYAGGTSAASGAKAGLWFASQDSSNRLSGLGCLLTSTFNTGWMNGNIKGAFLSDTDDTDLVGSGELVTNGTFDTDVTGWTDPTDGRSTASFASGKLRITNDTAGFGYAYQVLSLTVGKTYTVSWDVSAVGTLYATRVFWGNAEGTTSGGGASTASAVAGTQSITFVAQAATTYFHVQLFTASSGPTIQMDFDNISVKLADADRSVNNNGLVVNGTVTRTFVDEV